MADFGDAKAEKTYTLYPIGKVVRDQAHTFIVLDKRYQPGLMGMEEFSEVTVVYWFDRNDTPEKRSILKVHPRGNESNPLRGVFTTHAPMRPNLIAISRCKILSVKDNVIEIDEIDAFDDSPVLDLKG
ncbi:MAG: tRNA-Thr(GGU) m(6)t(6)A37 methyltransferase TsaA [Phycisphaerae bacterium SM23_30]|nr:MAG: tRNA-Thr(GGU) m(6)t(6)A37 methyltransferase TsaA [Phycisphaerae bacterium SM23_30]